MSTNTLNNVKVSVVMPVYNVENFVAASIESVLNQSFRDFELIIVNDRSPDKSLEICKLYTDSRIRIINHEINRGLAGARNTGIHHSKGDLVAFIDSDDIWHKDKLKFHVEHLDKKPGIGLSFSRSEFLEADGRKTGYHQMPKLKNISPAEILCRNPVGNGSAPVIRRRVLDQISYHDNFHGSREVFYFDARLRQSEDIECWLRIALQTNWKIGGIPQALTYYRLNEGGLSSSLFKQYDSWESVIERTRLYSPAFIAQWERRARAYQLRYLARQAIRLRDGKMAVYFLNRALNTDSNILFQEMARTLATLSAAYLMFIMPKSLYLNMESVSSHMVSRLQKLRITRDMQTAI